MAYGDDDHYCIKYRHTNNISRMLLAYGDDDHYHTNNKAEDTEIGCS